MIMTYVIVAMAGAAVVFGGLTGNMSAVSQAAVSGAKNAVELLLKIGGTICLWNGLLEVMTRSGLSELIAKLLKPVISLLFGKYGK